MGELIERIKLSGLVNSESVPDFFKKNSLLLYEKYISSDDDVKLTDVKDIYPGGFYFLHYKDNSDWMKYSPVFIADFKKYSNQIILFGVNFNFIPLEIRANIFDKFITEKDFEDNSFLKANLPSMYNELIGLGFEYAIVEYNAIQIVKLHRISLNILPRFLYSQHPIVKYDPQKLMEIWNAKIEGRVERDKEMKSSTLNDFYDTSKDISQKYEQLEGHIKRLRASMNKWGRS